MNKTTCKTLTASAVIGLQKGYSDEVISLTEFKRAVQIVQQEIKKNNEVLLSVKITQCEILFLGQDEPSITLDFIQYPKFPYKEEIWRNAVILFIESLMKELEQNRTVIVFPDITLMLEKSDEIDPKINANE
jgi:hypothetical protein